MVKMKKLLSLVLAGVMCASVVSFSSVATAAASSAKTITIGVDDTYPPMEFQVTGTKGDVGFDIDMANEIGKRIGMTVKFQPITWDGIFAGLNSKKFDCIVSSVSITSDRLKNYLFTKPYIANSQMIVVKKGDTTIKSTKDLKGVKVCCQVGTTANDSATKLIKKGINLNLTTYDQIIQCFQGLSANRAKAIIVDEVVGQYYIKKSPNLYASAALKLTNEPIGICFRKDSKDLQTKMQKALDAMSKDGSLKKISMKWFGKDLTSNIDTKLKML